MLMLRLVLLFSKWCDSWKVSIPDLRDLSNIMDTSLGRTIVCLHDCYLFDDNSSYFMKVCFHLIADLLSKILATTTFIGIIWKLSCNVDICKKINVIAPMSNFVLFVYCCIVTTWWCNHILRLSYYMVRGAQQECGSKPLKHSIVKRILVFKWWI